MLEKYVLDEHRNVQRSHNLMAWARWVECAGERVRVDMDFFWDCQVSTVFLPINHNFADHGPPLLFETMVFGGGDDDLSQWRWETWAAAEAGHTVVCKAVASRRPRWMRWAGRLQKFWWRFWAYEWDWATLRWEVR